MKYNIYLFIIIVGLLLLLAGSNIPNTRTFLGVNIQSFLSSAGIYIAILGSFQWIYDQNTKQELLLQVTKTTISNLNVASSGISDYLEHTHKIDYSPMLSTSKEVIIGFQYNSRIIDNNYSNLQARRNAKLNTIVLVADPNGSAIQFINQHHDKVGHIQPTIEKVVHKLRNINEQGGKRPNLVIKFHNLILRYSFVYSAEGIWVKPHRNSIGHADTPGIFIRQNSPLFNYYKKDVEELLEQSKDA